ASVEEWDAYEAIAGGCIDPRRAKSVRQMSSDCSTVWVARRRPAVSPRLRADEGLPHLVGPSFFYARPANSALRIACGLAPATRKKPEKYFVEIVPRPVLGLDVK